MIEVDKKDLVVDQWYTLPVVNIPVIMCGFTQDGSIKCKDDEGRKYYPGCLLPFDGNPPYNVQL